MDLSDDDLEKIRDEIGTDEPSDSVLYGLAEDLSTWRRVALRVLKRRRATNVAAAAGTVSSLSVPGAVSVGFSRGDIASLDRQIARLEAEASAEEGPDPSEVNAATARSYTLRRSPRTSWAR